MRKAKSFEFPQQDIGESPHAYIRRGGRGRPAKSDLAGKLNLALPQTSLRKLSSPTTGRDPGLAASTLGQGRAAQVVH